MIRSIEFDLETFSPNAVRFATQKGQRAHAERVKKQRKAVHDVLVKHFGAQVPGRFVVLGPEVKPNRIAVSFTRMAAGTLDAEENLPMAFKHVKDEIADWCGAKSDRDPIFTWGPYEQSKAAPHVQRVRLVIEDLTPGEPRRVVLAEMASAGREASARVRRQVTAQTKAHRSVCDPTATGKTPIPGYIGPCTVRDLERPTKRLGGIVQAGRVLSYQPEATARGASSAARGRAEAAFARLTGTPTATDLRDAAEGALQRRAIREKLPGSGKVANRDPGDEAHARDLADCETCGAKVPSPCRLDVGGRVVFGVHVARARAAGLHVPADDRAAVRPARVEKHLAHWTDHAIAHAQGVIDRADRAIAKCRKLATVPGQARLVARRVYLALPWQQQPCQMCDGEGCMQGYQGRPRCEECNGRGHLVKRLAREQRLEGVEVDRPTHEVRVPVEHRARWGDVVTLHRGERTIAPHGVCWVYA